MWGDCPANLIIKTMIQVVAEGHYSQPIHGSTGPCGLCEPFSLTYLLGLTIEEDLVMVTYEKT